MFGGCERPVSARRRIGFDRHRFIRLDRVFADGPHAEEFAARLRQSNNVLTPTVAIYEVYKWIKRERSEEEAIEAVATMKKTQIADLTEEIALAAADLSLAHGLAMADSMMLAFARTYRAELVTSDAGFGEMVGVTSFSKKRQP